MSQFLNSPISSTNAITSTIATDPLVFRWFLYLISQKKVRRDLAADGAAYSRLKKSIICQNLCSVALLAVLLYIFLTKQFLFLCGGAILAFIYLKLVQAVHKHVALLGMKVIGKHFDSGSVCYHTLYQIGERLAKHYHVRSLVMSMTSVDIIVRRIPLFVLVLVAFILPLNILPMWGSVLVAYWVACIIVNTSVVYNHLS